MSSSSPSTDPQSLSEHHHHAETLRLKLDTYPNSNTPSFQATLAAALASYAACIRLTAHLSLFSPNESLDDISSRDLQYLLLHFHTAELLFRVNNGARKDILLQARAELESFLKLLDRYDVLSKADGKLLERYFEDKGNFSTAAGAEGDAAARREAKIQRFREEKALKGKIEHLRSNPTALQNEDGALRELWLGEIAWAVHRAWASLESVGLEFRMLAMAPVEGGDVEEARDGQEGDARTRTKDANGYSERLDPSLASLMANANGGPILSSSGRPMRPFTLLDSRQRLAAGVFRPDHSLPTMTIDEYLEEEKKRGGIIEGGGEASMQREYVDEDDLAVADAATEKARYWDEFKEDNPKGAGNTMNRG